jgi:NADH-ubiquinone oxidoreductase chain 2
MLVIALLFLLLAFTSIIAKNNNYLVEYIKLNRIVFIIFILGGYLAYNSLYVESIGNGIGIYGGVFKITILSQVFDIILFITGGLVTILTCFVPYNFKNYDDSKAIKFILEKENKNIVK